MLGDGRLGDPELGPHHRAEPARRSLAVGEKFQQTPPHRIPQHVEHIHLRTVRAPEPGGSGASGTPYSGRSSSISVTRAAIGDRSERVSVTWANSGCPFSASMTAATP